MFRFKLLYDILWQSIENLSLLQIQQTQEAKFGGGETETEIEPVKISFFITKQILTNNHHCLWILARFT